ncbi:hypothetical protein [Actinopolymorpha pittospori]|uniref:Uncharacterized protein n=1 Tax=Actinopolymorpha pittospori TaxID=648752 RepID=A0A927RM41_9ACTN|nr:hypothetical protein [Actinopolymorpha pittospori]MBE1608523.1 hypothetical protein [Actinopolymorpha pittospori]
MADHLPRFDLLILLRIDEATMVRRLKDPGRANDFGRYGATLEWSLDWRPRLEAEMLEAGARPVDGQQPLANVVDDVLRLCTACSIDLSQN